jgi:ATP/maltotriose-dependent transcriptional regulator MalT
VFRYLMRGEIRTVRDWLDALPPDVLQADPALSTAFGWSLVLAGESEGVLDRVAAAERALATDPDAFDRMAVPSQLEALQARVAEMGGDLDASLVHTRAALDSIPGDVDRAIDRVFGLSQSSPMRPARWTSLTRDRCQCRASPDRE